MNKLNKLIQQQKEVEASLNTINEQVSKLQNIQNLIDDKRLQLNNIIGLLNEEEKEKLYLCKSYEVSAFNEAKNILYNTRYEIRNSFSDDYPEDYIITSFVPIINYCIPNKLLKKILNEYKEILESEIKQLEKELYVKE